MCVVCGVRALVSPAQVEQHNSHVQSNFAQRMDTAFGELQQRLQQQEGSQRHLLAGYTRAVGQHREFNKKKLKQKKCRLPWGLNCATSCAGGLLGMNEAGLKGALGTLESFVGGVGQLVDQGVARCQDKFRQQEALCLQDRESVLGLLVRAHFFC